MISLLLRIGWGGKYEVTGQIAPSQLTPKKRSCEPLPKKEVKLHSSLVSNLLTVDVFPDLTFPLTVCFFSLSIFGGVVVVGGCYAYGPCIPERACPNKQPSYKFSLH